MSQIIWIRASALLAVLMMCARPSYALADDIVSQMMGGLLFVVACGVAIIATLSALLMLATGNRTTSQKSAVVAFLALVTALLFRPVPSYTYESPEEAVTKVSHPFGLVMQPDTADMPTPIPPLKDYDPAADSTHFDNLYTYIGSMPQLVGGNTEAIRFVQKHLRYPEAARQHHTRGVVVVRFVVDEAGEVHNTEITRSLGHGCDEEALRVARGLPTFQNSEAVPVQLTWMFSFRPPEMDVSGNN